MVNLKRGRLTRREKKITIKDEKQLQSETKQLVAQTRKDLFNPGRMTIREMDKHDHEIDNMLGELDRVKRNVREGHSEYHTLKSNQAELNSWKKRLSMAKKAKKLGAKNEEVSRALREGAKKHTHGPLKSLLARLRNKKER